MTYSGDARWKSAMQLLFGLGLTVLFFYMMAPFIVPLLLGAITALLCYPTYKRLRVRIRRAPAAAVVTVGATVGVLVPVAFILISSSQQLIGWITQMKVPHGGTNSILAHPITRKALAVAGRFTPVDKAWAEEQILAIAQSVLEAASRIITGFLAGMPALVLGFFVIIISVYFFLVDGARFLRFLSSLSPLKDDRSEELYSSFEGSCRGVVLGLFLSAITQGVLIFVFFLVTQVPKAFLWGVVGILMGMVPVVGTAPVTIGAVIYHFGNGHTAMGVVMILAALIIGTLDNVVRSWVLKGQSEMHPLLALVSVFGATNLMGPPGIFLGPIIAAVFVSFLRILTFEIRRENIVLAAPQPPSS